MVWVESKWFGGLSGLAILAASKKSPEETPSPRRDSKTTPRYHVYDCLWRVMCLGPWSLSHLHALEVLNTEELWLKAYLCTTACGRASVRDLAVSSVQIPGSNNGNKQACAKSDNGFVMISWCCIAYIYIYIYTYTSVLSSNLWLAFP